MTILKAVGALSMVAALAMPAAAQQCPIPQSPRDINPRATPSPYDGSDPESIVEQTNPAWLVYDGEQTLYFCDQHYHSPVENTQGCPGEIARPWVEVHTVYAANKRPAGCKSTLDCCKEGPIVVRAFAARVTAGGTSGPILPPTGRPLAEWSGSVTGTTPFPNDCNPAADWSFRLGCGFTVSEAQLHRLGHAHPPRRLQTSRLSDDLTLVP